MFKTLSVAEANYESDKIILEHIGWRTGQKLRVEISSKKQIAFNHSSARIQINDFTRADLRSLIVALQEAEVFLAEAALVEKLIGKI
jgi:hypothetical protein